MVIDDFVYNNIKLTRYRSQIQVEADERNKVEAEELKRHKLTEEKLRKRCSRFRDSFNEVKLALHQSHSDLKENKYLMEELISKCNAYKVKIETFEGENLSRDTEIRRCQSLIRESNSIIAQYEVQLIERDRGLDRAHATIGELQGGIRNLEEQRTILEKKISEAQQELAHIKSISDSALHQAEESCTRAKESERKAQRDLGNLF